MLYLSGPERTQMFLFALDSETKFGPDIARQFRLLANGDQLAPKRILKRLRKRKWRNCAQYFESIFRSKGWM